MEKLKQTKSSSREHSLYVLYYVSPHVPVFACYFLLENVYKLHTFPSLRYIVRGDRPEHQLFVVSSVLLKIVYS